MFFHKIGVFSRIVIISQCMFLYIRSNKSKEGWVNWSRWATIWVWNNMRRSMGLIHACQPDEVWIGWNAFESFLSALPFSLSYYSHIQNIHRAIHNRKKYSTIRWMTSNYYFFSPKRCHIIHHYIVWIAYHDSFWFMAPPRSTWNILACYMYVYSSY